jgi:hypothetical protein
MKGFVNTLFVFVLLYFVFCVSVAESTIKELKEGQLIRRVYLDLLGVPPSSKELNWYLMYNSDPYQIAVNTIVPTNITPTLRSFIFSTVLSEAYKKQIQTPLEPRILELIVKYQCGMLEASTEEANKKLVEISLKAIEDDLNPLDYMAENLLGRITTAQEETELLKIIKKYPSEQEGYLEALKKMKSFPDFLNK